MNMDKIIGYFKSMDVVEQTESLLFTDYASMYLSLRDYYKGPLEITDNLFLNEPGWSFEISRYFLNPETKKMFSKDYPELRRNLRLLFMSVKRIWV